MYKVSVIIATYNGIDYLQKCLPTVLQTKYSNYEVIICDDCSTDGSYTYLTELQKQHSHLKILRNESNLGAAKTRNNAVAHATGEVLAFLDNDTQVDPKWMQQPIELLTNDQSIGGVQSLLIEYDDRTHIQLAGVKLIPHACWGAPIARHTEVENRSQQSTDIIALSAALFVRTSVHHTIQGFDEKLAVYTEDLEYSLRIWISGSRIINAPDSFVYHWTKKVSDRQKMHASQAQIYFHLTKNSLRSLIKNYSVPYLICYLPWCLAIIVVRFSICFLRRDFASAKAVVKGLAWTLQNMSDTLNQRKIIQSLRKTSDQEIAQKVFTAESISTIYSNYFAK